MELWSRHRLAAGQGGPCGAWQGNWSLSQMDAVRGLWANLLRRGLEREREGWEASWDVTGQSR